jgi:ADP-ribose pyrophosphatase
VADFFFYGTLRHAPLLELVLGRRPELLPARLEDHAAYWAAGECFPVIRPEAGTVTKGVLARGLDADETARLDFYEGGFGYGPRALGVRTDAGALEQARVYLPEPGRWEPGARWDLAEWQERWAEVVVEAAREFMAQYGARSSAEVLAHYPMLLARAEARLRARRGGPTTLRHAAAPEDLEVHDHRYPYFGFFSIEEVDLRFRGQDGAMHGPVMRAAFATGDAVTVLPYDAPRDRVLVVEQFRMGPFARGDSQPWTLEAVAGRIDGGETPETAARRELQEEAGLSLSELLPVADYYPTPGAVAEHLYSYVGLTDLPDLTAWRGGEPSETEDIRAHVIDFDRLMALIASGEVNNGPLILTALWLSRERDRLRRGA